VIKTGDAQSISIDTAVVSGNEFVGFDDIIEVGVAYSYAGDFDKHLDNPDVTYFQPADMIHSPFTVTVAGPDLSQSLHPWLFRTYVKTAQGIHIGNAKQLLSVNSFNGKVLYQSSTRQATVKLYDSAEKLICSTETALDGAYTLAVPIAPAGTTYTLKVTKPGYLPYTIKNLMLTDGQAIETIDIRQLAGDVNGDGVVNAIDLTQLLSEFNREPVNYWEADIDGNGIVNAADLTYLLAGFNKRAVIVGD
jgi:hypothetical protein